MYELCPTYNAPGGNLLSISLTSMVHPHVLEICFTAMFSTWHTVIRWWFSSELIFRSNSMKNLTVQLRLTGVLDIFLLSIPGRRQSDFLIQNTLKTVHSRPLSALIRKYHDISFRMCTPAWRHNMAATFAENQDKLSCGKVSNFLSLLAYAYLLGWKCIYVNHSFQCRMLFSP